MIALLVAAAAGAGAYLLVTSVLGQPPQARRVAHGRPSLRSRSRDWLTQAGLVEVRPVEFVAITGLLFVTAAAAGYGLFGTALPALVVGGAAAAAPAGVHRSRRTARLATAQQAWPRLIGEVRLRATTLGRSLPQALFEAGEHAPDELRPAFTAAHREWLLSFDFARALDVLKRQLADPTADATCETLLVAHEVGGTDLGPRLEALAEDRQVDADTRKEARARQAGVRFARRFVLLVPAGMAVAGSLIGGGRAAYGTPTGQLAVLAALAMVAGCWLWSGRYLRLPSSRRVFVSATGRSPAATSPEQPELAA